MGGKNPLVVMDDADWASRSPRLSTAFGSTGQRCTASSRLIVRTASRRLVARLAEAMAGLRVGRRPSGHGQAPP